MFQNPFNLNKGKQAENIEQNSSETSQNLFTDSPGTETHFVNPHDVQGYTRNDGIEVDGYWRDGDSDTSVDLSVEEGGGYDQTNPDGDPSNNLG